MYFGYIYVYIYIHISAQFAKPERPDKFAGLSQPDSHGPCEQQPQRGRAPEVADARQRSPGGAGQRDGGAGQRCGGAQPVLLGEPVEAPAQGLWC